MDNLISRQAAIDAAIYAADDWDGGCNINRSEMIEKAINELPSVTLQPKTEWIPVSKRLPEEDGDYFVTLENGVVTKLGYSTTQRTTFPKGFYYISNGFSWRQTINPVIAWMPLPESYKPTDSNCDSCEHKNEVDGSNCYECVKGIRDNYKAESEE